MSDEALHDGYAEMPYLQQAKLLLRRKILCPDREFFCHVFVFNEFLIDCEGKPRFQYHSKIPEPKKCLTMVRSAHIYP